MMNNSKIKHLLFALIALLSFTAKAQMIDPVSWETKLSTEGDNATLTISASIDRGWHIYSTDLSGIDFGPQATTFSYSSLSGLEAVDSLVPSTAPTLKFDETFQANINYWEDAVSFTQKFKITDTNYSIEGSVVFQACSNSTCTAPMTFNFSEGNATAVAPAAVAASNTFDPTTRQLWTPVNSSSSANDIAGSSLWSIFLWGFLGGLVALMTPCVWPMIPLTVSFFLKKNTSRRKSIRDASIYGASIVVIYLLLGLLVTLIFGASKLNDLSTNAIFNLIFFALLVVFAVSFFGAFDIKLPSRWSNAMDSKAENATGLLSIFFMAFTLALVSFSCTGPIIGTLLVEAATMGNIVGPAVGMGAFALALAIPFALFATFPSMLKEMPRSGGWLNSVKVVLGFLELALSLKFLSVADLAYGWHILDREVFISLWVVIFALLGLYLLGKLRFPHDAPRESTGVGSFFLALISLSFAVYLIPGLWGAPLKSCSAFVPPLYTQDFNLYDTGKYTTFDDYEEGMQYAEEKGMPVLIDFSGYGCVNCRKMEGAVFDNSEIAQLLGREFVVIELMVDDKHELDVPFEVVENGKTTKINTVGDKWSFLQRYKFAANSQPFYMVLDNNGEALSDSYSYDEDVDKFKTFLENGLKKYNE